MPRRVCSALSYFFTPKGDRFYFVGDQGCVPIVYRCAYTMQIEFSFSACLIDEGSVVSVVLPIVVCGCSDIFLEDLIELPPYC